MKRIIILIALLFVTNQVEAAFYLIDINNVVRYKQNGPATQENLDIDGLIQIETVEDIPLAEAEYRGGKIVRHTKTASEIAEEAQEKVKKDKKVVDKGNARAKLITLGLSPDEADTLLE